MAKQSIDQQKQIKQLWEAMGKPWEDKRQWQEDLVRSVTETMLRQLDPKIGQIVLELAAGNGETGLLIAQKLGENGRLILTDLSSTMLEAAKRRGEQLKVHNVDYRLMDAQHIDLSDASVDGVVCRWGYMLMPDYDKALAETRRVLRPGGRLSFAVWGEARDNPFFTVPGSALIDGGYFRPDPSAPNMFTLGTNERLVEVTTNAGFAKPEIERVPIAYNFVNSDDLWSFVSKFAGPLAMTISQLSSDIQADVRKEIERRAEPFRDGEGYSFPGVCLVAVTS